MIKLRTLCLGLGGAALLALPLGGLSASMAQVTKQGSGYMMRIKWQNGKTYKFNLDVSMSQGGSPMTMKSPVTMAVSGVKDGIATLKVTMSGLGGGGAAAKPRTSEVKVNSRGRVVGGDQNVSLLIGLPEKPVAVGQSWTDSFTSRNQMGAGMKVNAKYTLKAVKKVGSRQVAEITTSNTSAGGGMSSSGSGTYNVDLADGMLISGTIKQTVTITSGKGENGKPQTMSIPTTVTISRA